MPGPALRVTVYLGLAAKLIRTVQFVEGFTVNVLPFWVTVAVPSVTVYAGLAYV